MTGVRTKKSSEKHANVPVLHRLMERRHHDGVTSCVDSMVE